VAQAKNLRAVGDRIEALTGELRSLADPHARETAEELVRLLVDFYGEGLARVLEIVYESPGAGELFGRFADDPLVASLLLLHGLHPLSVEDRILGALEKVRPHLGSHGGDVRLLGIGEDGVVRLLLEGACHGCPSSAITMKLAVERAIEEAAPEVTRIEVEGLAQEGGIPPGNPLVQIDLRCPSELEGNRG
jgi:Fe-S cluster biogenesis protein NfuA